MYEQRDLIRYRDEGTYCRGFESDKTEVPFVAGSVHI